MKAPIGWGLWLWTCFPTGGLPFTATSQSLSWRDGQALWSPFWKNTDPFSGVSGLRNWSPPPKDSPSRIRTWGWVTISTCQFQVDIKIDSILPRMCSSISSGLHFRATNTVSEKQNRLYSGCCMIFYLYPKS